MDGDGDGEMERTEGFRQWFGAAAGLYWFGLVRSGAEKGRSKTIQAKDAEPRMFNCARDCSVFSRAKTVSRSAGPLPKTGKADIAAG